MGLTGGVWNMKLKVEVDMEDFYDSFDLEAMAQILVDELNAQILRRVKSDPLWEEFINKQASAALSSLTI